MKASQWSNRSKAISLLLVGALTSSFIAPVSRLSEGIQPITLLCFASLIAVIGHCAYLKFDLPWRQIREFKRPAVIAFLGGAVLTWSYVGFAWSIRESSNEMIPTLTFELYPLGVIVFSNFLLYREKLSRAKLGWLALSVVGVVLVSGGASDSSPDGGWSPDLGTPLLAAILAVSMLSLGMTLVSKSVSELEQFPDAPILASLIARIGGVLTTIPVVIFGYASVSFSFENVSYVLFYGIVILTISNFAYYKGVAISDTHLINVIWYVTPVLSIIWLSLLGYGSITRWVGIGAAFVIAANIMLHLSARRRQSFRITIVWILSIGTVLTVVPGASTSFEYFDAITALLFFFALLHGFAMNRLKAGIATERELAVEIIRSEELRRLTREKFEAIRQAVAELPKSASSAAYDRLYSLLEESEIKGATRQMLEKFILSRTHNLAVGELFVMLITGGMVIFLGVFVRPTGWEYSAFAMVATTGVVFTFLVLIDLIEERYKPVFDIWDSGTSDLANKLVISKALVMHEPQAERWLVASLAVTLIVVFVIVFIFQS